jgi:ribosomal protein L14
MIGILTKVNIIDNSGGIEGKCINILNPKSTKTGRKKKTAKVGDLILISLTKSLPSIITTSPKKGNIYKALIVRTKKESNKYIRNRIEEKKEKEKIRNMYINKNINFLSLNYSQKTNRKLKAETIRNSFDDNAVVLVKVGKKKDIDYTPLGTRIKGPICKNLRFRKGCSKIVSITS